MKKWVQNLKKVEGVVDVDLQKYISTIAQMQ